MTEIGAFEAKNQFSRLIERARHGEAFTITHRGVAVAKLVPVCEGPDVAKAREALARLRAGAKQRRGAPISRDEILKWIAEGRR
ncbi:MAG TPA: type II toxin-antitoxin system prevent-host-death family antitoxin [Caulobacteraceae bacterium]|nr:type II toxin-antitoxin system prevent-host-death family antitoxin [Caulobacteraceae bacterium]